MIGAGIGGLAASLRLAHAGLPVRVLDMADGPGGKMRTVPSAAGPVDSGPTVFTMKRMFDRLFADVGEHIDDHLPLVRESVLARHWWPDGAQLDLHVNRDASAAAVRDFAGAAAERQFRRFCQQAERLFDAFRRPVMEAPAPDIAGIAGASVGNPGLLPALLPGRSLMGLLEGRFTDPRLRQLFGRYATYVGGSPWQSPAILALIWRAEEAGVWRIHGGMHRLALMLERLAALRGATFHYGNPVEQIERTGNWFAVRMRDGQVHSARQIVFNGDPAALARGLLGEQVKGAVTQTGIRPRALSAFVWSFAAAPSGRVLGHHNVLFNDDYSSEFADIGAGRMPKDPAIYVCAQDRGAGASPSGTERFEIIINGAPVGPETPRANREYEQCREMTFTALEQRGLTFTPLPDRPALTTPHDFAERFPASAGSLYGLSPHGTRASFRRPVTRTPIPGLFLCGGGVHPGAGIPMALTSGRHAAEAILKRLASTSTSRRTGTRGGTSTDSRTMANAESRS